MAARAQVALGKRRFAENSRKQSGGDAEQDKGPSRRFEPNNSGGGGKQLESGAQELAAEFGDAAQTMGGVAALGHIRDETALKIAIAQFRNFAQECDPEPVFDVAAETSGARKHRQFQ